MLYTEIFYSSVQNGNVLDAFSALRHAQLREAAKNILRGGVPQSRGLRPQSTDPP